MNDHMITIDGIRKEYPGRVALKGVSFSVKKGRVHGFLGPNGAGKSTTMKIITGALKANDGKVSLLEEARIGYLPENPPLYMNMKVRDYLQFVQNIYSLNDSNNKRDLFEVLKKCGLDEVENRLIRNLSKGYKQRVGIAQTLVHDPEIIILDEPTVGLDPDAIMEIRDLIKELSENHTILLSTHQLHEANLLCEDITIINKGEIMMSGEVEEIKKKLQTNQHINMEVIGLDEDKVSKMESKLPLKVIDKKPGEDTWKLSVKATTPDDIRPSLSHFLIENECTPITLIVKEMDLEGIFKEVTGGNNA